MRTRCFYERNGEINSRATAAHWKSLVDRCGKFQREVAKAMNVSDSFLSELLAGKKNWTEAIALKLERATAERPPRVKDRRTLRAKEKAKA